MAKDGKIQREGKVAVAGLWFIIQILIIKTLFIISAPKQQDGPKSLDEIEPEILATYEKLGIPLAEQKMLSGVAVDAVFDSVSVATTF